MQHEVELPAEVALHADFTLIGNMGSSLHRNGLLRLDRRRTMTGRNGSGNVSSQREADLGSEVFTDREAVFLVQELLSVGA